MEIVIPALATSSAGSGGSAGFYDTIDSLYNAYTVRLLQLNKYNARNDGVDDSQAFWGLGQIPERYNQCANWNADYSASTVSGTGALSLFSTTFSFSQNIDQIDDGVVRFGLFENSTADRCIEFTDGTGDITDIDLSGNTTSALGLNNKGYIATSGGNKFLVVANGTVVYSYPLDADNNIIAGTVNSYTCANIASTVRRVFVAAAIGDDIWIGQCEGATTTSALGIRILTINSSGVLSNVATGSQTAVSAGTQINGQSVFGSYVVSNTCYIMCIGHLFGTTEPVIFGSIDLTSTGSVSYTNIYTYLGTPFFGATQSPRNNNIVQNIGYDGSNIIVELQGTIYSVSGSGLTVVGVAINERGFIRFRNSVAKMTTPSLNFYSNRSNRSFAYKGKQYSTYNTANSEGVASTICAVYLMTGANAEDDTTAMVEIICADATQASDGLDINVNGSAYQTGVNIIGGAAAILFSTETITATSIKMELDFANSNTKDKKMGFGIYAGTYGSPTGANGLSGSTSTGADVSTAGSYLDLLFI